MSQRQVAIVSAFGRADTLALALHEAGFHVGILDFTGAFPSEMQRGAGPFPVIDKAFFQVQQQYLDEVELQEQGLIFWLKDGPLELTGPFAATHRRSDPALQAWKTNAATPDFASRWLQNFLRQWASPVFAESWEEVDSPPFPAELAMGSIPAKREAQLHSFERARGKGIDVTACRSLSDAHVSSGRLSELEIEVEAGTSMVVKAQQWIWCLSAVECKRLGEKVTGRIFGTKPAEPEWAWLSFQGSMQKGPWTTGLPASLILLGDIFLPWFYANASILRRLDEQRFRIWIKVPRLRTADIDARRGWAADLQKLLMQRLSLAEWRIDSAEWGLCPNSEVFSQAPRLSSFKNMTLIIPETLPRLDMSARLEMEANCYRQLNLWRSDFQKTKGARRDQTLHPA